MSRAIIDAGLLMGIRFLFIAAVLAMCPVAHADVSNWTATSTASMSITGDITIFDDRIVFGNKAEISIVPVGPGSPDVYRVDPPADPVLANGNRLCSEETAPTFIVLGRSDDARNLGDSSSLYLKVFDGPDEPSPFAAEGMIGGGPGLCAILNYERASSPPPGAGAASLGRDPIRQAQELLNALGYDAGPPDGVAGPRTRRALAAFQARSGLPATGALNQETLTALTRLADSGTERPDQTATDLSSVGGGPSFDCRRAQTVVERTICAEPLLGALDAALADSYRMKTARLNDAEAGEERARQNAWLALRDRCGGDVACLEQAYEGRIAVLSVGSEQPIARQAGASPEETVRAIYATLDAPAPQQRMEAMRASDQRARHFVPGLVALFDAHDNEECIDFSLVLNGQDFDSSEIVRTLTIETTDEGDRSFVDATFTRFGDQNHFRYEFVRDGYGWKIADIASLGHSEWRLSEFSCGSVSGAAQVSAATPAAPARADGNAPVTAAGDTARSPAPVLANANETPAPLSAFRDCETCPEMVVMPRGSYWMGSDGRDSVVSYQTYMTTQLGDIPPDEPLGNYYQDFAALTFGGGPEERPRHLVTIDYDFAIGRYELTVGQYREFLEDTGYKLSGVCYTHETDANGTFNYTHTGLNASQEQLATMAENNYGLRSDGTFYDPGYEQTDEHPAVCISVADVRAYFDWLNKKTGRSYRLPSEAEWEYATRAGTETAYSFGDSPLELCEYANFLDKSSFHLAGLVYCDDGYPGSPAPVGTYKPNPFGLYDVHGNVFEPVEDCFFGNYEGAPTDGSPWTKDDCSDHHVLRSYYFASPYFGVRSASRCPAGHVLGRSSATGVRVAVSLSGGAWDLK